MDRKFQLVGLIRPEKFGGIYYERNRLVIELLNTIGYEIIRLIKSNKSMSEIVDFLYHKYDADKKFIERDVEQFIIYLKKSKYIVDDTDNIDSIIENKNMNNLYPKNFEMENFVLGMKPYELRSPLKVLLELTYSCNLRCIHCFADADFCCENRMVQNELSYEDWCKIIDNIIKNDVFEILLSGGEATMRDDLIKICDYISSKGRSYSLLTNATLIDKKMAKDLKRTGCAKVESNLDGYDQETYERFRGVKGSFEKTISGIKACLDEGIQVRCNVMETKMTIFDLKKIVDTAYEIGVRELCVIPLEMGGRAKNIKKLCFGKEDIKMLNEFYEDVNDWFDNKYKNTDMLLFTPNQFSRNGSKYSKVFDVANVMPRCGAGLIHCTINPFGIVKMCPTDHSLLIAENRNVLHEDLSEIWENSKILKMVRGSNFKKCVHCNESCEMECPVIRYETHGKLEYSCNRGG